MDMKSILLTGATGFIGRNIRPALQTEYNITAPSRAELNLLDAAAVRRYLAKGRFDAVVHLANPTGHNPLDPPGELFERSLRVFSSLLHCGDLYGRMLYIGSGAEYGKHRALAQISEERFGEESPRDAYGLSRYLMSELAETRENVINLRLFGCYGPGDPPHKLTSHIIRCIREGEGIALRQDVWFDFLYVMDIAPVLRHFIENPQRHGAYNLCSGERIRILAIAEKIRDQMRSNAEIVFEKEGLHSEYTGTNERLRAELPGWRPRDIDDGIKEILKSMGI